MEDAIREGVIGWHAFPFDAQLELMNEELIRTSVGLVHDLDKRFGLPPKITMSQVQPLTLSLPHYDAVLLAGRFVGGRQI